MDLSPQISHDDPGQAWIIIFGYIMIIQLKCGVYGSVTTDKP